MSFIHEMKKLNILRIDDPEKIKRVQRLFKFERIFCPPDLKIESSKVSLKLIKKFIFPDKNQSLTNDYLDLLAKFGSINNHHSIPRCLCGRCRNIILSNRKAFIGSNTPATNQFLIRGFFDQNCPKPIRGKMTFNERSLSRYFNEMQSDNVLVRTLSGNSNIRIHSGNTLTHNFVGSLKKLDELELVRFGNLLCKKCLEHCQSQIHLFGGAFKNHILSPAELKQLIHTENLKDLRNIIFALKSKW